jgi:hypothetical protein
MEGARSSETLVTIYETSRRRIPEDGTVKWPPTQRLHFKDGA